MEPCMKYCRQLLIEGNRASQSRTSLNGSGKNAADWKFCFRAGRNHSCYSYYCYGQ